MRTANPGDLQQNGFCERHIGIWKQVGFLIDPHAGGLPPSFWEYKELQAALILNLFPNYKQEDGSYWSPMDLWMHAKDADRSSRLRIYGCSAYIYLHEKDRMQGINAHRAVYLGEFSGKSVDRKAFIFLDLETRTIVSSCQCHLIEIEFPFRTKNWMSKPIFDEYEHYEDQTSKVLEDSQFGGGKDEQVDHPLSPIITPITFPIPPLSITEVPANDISEVEPEPTPTNFGSCQLFVTWFQLHRLYCHISTCS